MEKNCLYQIKTLSGETKKLCSLSDDGPIKAIVSELKAYREASGVSITEVAKRIGTERARISEIENGRGGLTLKRMFLIAEALGLVVKVEFERSDTISI